MFYLSRPYRDNKGMTLIEVMMAVAVFGIIMTTFVMAVKGYYLLNTDNLDQMRMMELARAETEMIKNNQNDLNTLDGVIATRAYPPNTTRAATGGEQTYKIKYKKELTTDPRGTMLKITVAPETATDLDNDPYNYFLVSWLPDTALLPTPITSITLSSPPICAVNGTVQLTVIATDSFPASYDVTALSSFTSSDNSIATVDSTGLVTGNKQGPVTITANYLQFEATTIITITETAPTLDSITLTANSYTLTAGSSANASVTAHYSDGSQIVVTTLASYHTSDNTIANVSNNGLITTGLKAGSVDIWASYLGKSSNVIRINVIGGEPKTSTLLIDDWGYTSDLGTDPIKWPFTNWTIGDGSISKNGGNSGPDYLYYKVKQETNFDYIAYLYFTKIRGHGDKVGITIGTNEFYLLNDKLYYNHINIPLTDPSFAMKTGVKYFLRANKVGTSMYLHFGYFTPNNEIGTLNTTIAPGNYYVGIFDQSTSNLNDVFSFPN